jgi:CubicO group peptidase (beta-lactamase class C family)
MRLAGWCAVAVAVSGVTVAAIAWRGANSQSAPSPVAAIPPARPVQAAAAQAAPAWDAAAVDSAARELPWLHSLLVSQHGTLVFERYYNGRTAGRLANIKSASKSVISALVGIAIERGLIPGLDTPVATYFPELKQDPDPRKQTITIEHLLAMRAGLEGTSNRNYGAWVTSRNWVRYVLTRPMFEPPDTEMEYSTGNTHLLSAILTKVTGGSTWQFATDALAKPLGFTLARWARDPQGIYFGGNDMLMTPRQMRSFGELYLNDGRVDDRQIVPAAWVERSCDGRVRNRRPGRSVLGAGGGADPMRDRKYGLGWWVHDIQGHETCFAWGYGGQYIFVVPDLELFVVTTSSPDVSEERRVHRRLLFDILDRLVVTPLAAIR